MEMGAKGCKSLQSPLQKAYMKSILRYKDFTLNDKAPELLLKVKYYEIFVVKSPRNRFVFIDLVTTYLHPL